MDPPERLNPATGLDERLPRVHYIVKIVHLFNINLLPDTCDFDSQLFLYADNANVYEQIFKRQNTENLQRDHGLITG